MFCTKCGRKLHEQDQFCAYCGTKVRRDEDERDERPDSRYSDVVFNPPFKLEAEKRTEEISRGIKEYSSEPRRERVDFNWNLDGFPGSRPRRDDNFEFNWDEVLEKRRSTREIDVEKLVPGSRPEAKTETEKEPAAAQAPAAEETPAGTESGVSKDTGALSIEDLEKELFGEAPGAVSPDAEKELEMTLQYRREDLNREKDKFYTYNAKKDAFQELLDKEKARLEKLEEEHEAQWQSLTPEDVKNQQTKEPPAFEDIFVEPELFHGSHLQEESVALPPQPPQIVAAEEETAAEAVEVAEAAKEMQPAAEAVEAAEAAETEVAAAPPFQPEPASEPDQPAEPEHADEPKPPAESEPTGEPEPPAEPEKPAEKIKLRYSDVFPREDLDADSGADDGGDPAAGEKEKLKQRFDENCGQEDDEEDEKKGKPVLKIVIIILAVLVALEVAVIGIKLAAPESSIARSIDGFVAQVTGVFAGGTDEGDEQEPEPTVTTSFITEYINEASAQGQTANIGSILENAELTYDPAKSYAFDEIAESAEFQNGVWRTADDGSETYVGQQIVGNMIAYFNAMKDEGTLPEGVVGINSLEIGQIKTGESGYYVLTRLTYANEDGSETSGYYSVYLTVTDDKIAVKEIKEENI